MKTETQPVSKPEESTLRGMFLSPEGKSYAFTFALVSSLFLLWGFCNGMIDVMDKHFQEELKLTLSQSAWVQFAHYLGYFLMALPAGWLATRLGYKGGIIAGLLLVAFGGLWFVPATKIAAFWAFLTGVCAIAAGLTFLETVANPYTTVLGPARYGASRINLAQSCNGVGWILGPMAGSLFFYGKDQSGRSTGAETLWIPYAGVAVVVLVLAVVFYFAPVPDVKAEDDYHIDEDDQAAQPAPAAGGSNGLPVYLLLLANVTVLIGIFGMILWLILNALGVGPGLVDLAAKLPRFSSAPVTADNALSVVLTGAGCVAWLVAATWLFAATRRLSTHSIWAHEHFSGATLAQFFYVAAQAGIFSFLINYVTSEPPSLPSSWLNEKSKWLEVRTAFAPADFKDLPGLAARLSEKSDPLSAHIAAQLLPSTVQTIARHKAGTVDNTALRVALTQDLNSIIQKENLYTPERFAGVALSDKTREIIAPDAKNVWLPRLNRLLLADAYPRELGFQDGIIGVSNQGAANLVSFGFGCFLVGRITGAFLLRRFAAHKVLGLYGALNVAACGVVFLKLGWISVACVFLSYFFMSIMFPTIFALGIFGLGGRAKRASAYIVMAIMGGAILPKLMGHVADLHGMSRSFIVPLACFALVALYGLCWPRLSKTEGVRLNTASGGH